jgi:hypothetical protein
MLMKVVLGRALLQARRCHHPHRGYEATNT